MVEEAIFYTVGASSFHGWALDIIILPATIPHVKQAMHQYILYFMFIIGRKAWHYVEVRRDVVHIFLHLLPCQQA